MDAFRTGMARLFADPNLGAPAFYVTAEGYPALRCRVIVSNPTGELTSLGTLRMAAPSAAVDILQSDLPERPRRGASVVVQDREFRVEEVTADNRNLRWHLVLSTVPFG